MKSFLKFALIVVVAQVLTYFIGGIIAQLVLGANEFYPPSTHALSYLRDPHEISLLVILGAGGLRGFLFALVLYPFRQRILEWGTVYASLAFAAIILILGYVAASGGMIEHFVYFTESQYPVRFAVITLAEITIQTLLLGATIVELERWLEKDILARPVHRLQEA
jgi:hypothetical protein